jgi:hypothetical protein
LVYRGLIQEGDMVLLKNEKPGKLDPLWLGPYKVAEMDRHGSNAILELNKKKRSKVHINRLKPYWSTIVSGDRK